MFGIERCRLKCVYIDIKVDGNLDEVGQRSNRKLRVDVWKWKIQEVLTHEECVVPHVLSSRALSDNIKCSFVYEFGGESE